VRHRHCRALGTVALVAAALLTSERAHAQKGSFGPGGGKAWAAAQNVLPGSVTIVVGANVAALKGTTVFSQVVQPLINKERDAKEGIDLVKSSCNIDVTAAVTDIVVAIDPKENGAIFLGVTGVDEAKVTACLQAVAAKKDAKAKITAARTGNVVEYSATGENDKLYVAWLAADVLVMATEPTDKKLLGKMIGGKGALGKSDVGKSIKATNTSAVVWAAVKQKESLGKGNATMKMAYGAIDLKAGTVSADVHVVVDSAAAATKAVGEFNKAAVEMQKDPKSAGIPQELANVLKSLKVSNKGADLNVTASMSEKELLGLINQMMAGM